MVVCYVWGVRGRKRGDKKHHNCKKQGTLGRSFFLPVVYEFILVITAAAAFSDKLDQVLRLCGVNKTPHTGLTQVASLKPSQ